MTASRLVGGRWKPTSCSSVRPLAVVTVNPCAVKACPPWSTVSTRVSPSSRSAERPTPTTSAEVITAESMRRPLTKVPLPLPRSRSSQPDPRRSSTACRRDTSRSSSTTSLSGSRPTVSRALSRIGCSWDNGDDPGSGSRPASPADSTSCTGTPSAAPPSRRAIGCPTSSRLTRRDPMNVPLLLWSVRVQPAGPGVSTRCRRDTFGWLRSRSTSGPRPTTNGRPCGTGTRRPSTTMSRPRRGGRPSQHSTCDSSGPTPAAMIFT